MNKVILFATLLIVVSCTKMATNNPIYPSKILVHGHRGARAIMPENTISAFKYALKVGVDVLELDLAVTKDLQLIVTHNPIANDELCIFPKGLKKPFYELSLKEVKRFDCGSKENPRFTKQKRISGEKIPTLKEVFELTQNNKKILFNIETKIYPASPDLTPTPELFSKLLVNEIEKYNLVDRVIVQSFDYRSLKVINKLNSNIQTAQLTYENLIDVSYSLKETGIDYLSPYYKWITKEQINNLHRIGIKTAPWTVNDENGWKKMIELGVDGIITDDPEALIKYLKRANLR